MTANKYFRTAIVLVMATLATFAPLSAPVDAARPLLPPGFSSVTLGSGLSEPTAMAFAGNRIFVLEKGGAIRVIRPNGSLRPTPYHTLSVSTSSERGLLGIALDPDWENNGRLYVYYTTGPGAKKWSGTPVNRVSRLKKKPSGQGFKERILLDNLPSDNGNHNGGDIHFGPDGKLYVAVGDSGCCAADAQQLDTPRGKILRINRDGTIPSDNPFFNTPNARKEIYAFGFRNPWRFTFRGSNGALIAADVGQGDWEEIDDVSPGGNYGWNDYEGPCPTENTDCDPALTNFGNTTPPIHYYNHSTGDETGTAVIGGVFATNSNYPAPFANSYFYGDLGGGWIHALELDGNNQVIEQHTFDAVDCPSSFGNGPDGNVYVVDYCAGHIVKYVCSP